MFGFGIFRGMKLVPRISVVHNFFGGQSVRARIIFNIKKIKLVIVKALARCFSL